MKKSLLALAAMGAFASVAQAQSSVTVYGVIDEGYVGGNVRSSNGTVATTGAAPTAATATAGTTGVVKKTGSGFTGGNESTNRFGIRGTEDLGGGMSAFFTYETGIAADGETAAGAASMWGTTRQAFVGVKKNGIGQVALGTQNTVVYDAILATAPTGVNNITGSLVDNMSTKGPQGNAAYQTGLGTTSGYETRIGNTLGLKSDKFAGFNVRAQLTSWSSNTTETSIGGAGAGVGGTNNVNGAAIGLDYGWQKLFLTANYQSYTASSNANAQSTAPILFGATVSGAGGGQNALGVNVRDVGQYYAATYDFGILKGFVQYLNRKATTDSLPTAYSKFTAQQIGVRSFITPALEGWIAGSMGKYQSLPQTSTGTVTYTPGQANLTAMQVGANYFLSKRTNLYAIYGQTASSNVAFSAVGNTTSANVNNYALGVRHTF
jgi:predicted porin